MEQEDSNSTIDYQIKDDDFTDASDSFDSDNHILISHSHSFNNITDTFLDSDSNSKSSINNNNNNHKSKRKLHSTRSRSTSINLRKLLHHQNNNDSEITTLIDNSITSDSPESDSSFLFVLSGLLIKVIGFQLNLLVNSVTFPIWLTYYSYMFIIHPFSSIRLAKVYILDKLSTVFGMSFSCVKSIIYSWIKKNESTWKLCFQIGWGLLWSVYVGFILISLLLFAFLISGVIMKCILVKPIQITEMLSFDYTKDTPVAFVPLMSCPDPSFLECSELIKPGSSGETRVIPLDHKVYATVVLTLPESYYNRNLGVFQVCFKIILKVGNVLVGLHTPYSFVYRYSCYIRQDMLLLIL